MGAAQEKPLSSSPRLTDGDIKAQKGREVLASPGFQLLSAVGITNLGCSLNLQFKR